MRYLWLLSVGLLGGPVAAQEAAQPPVPAIPQTQWPPVYEPLEVTITPEWAEKPPDVPEGPEPVPEWATVPLKNGATGDLRAPLERTLSHDPGWRGDGQFSESQTVLRPDGPAAAGDDPLIEKPDLAAVLGRRFFGRSIEQIFVSFGLMPDGSKPLDTGRGVYTPIDPVHCFEGGISCRESVAKKHVPLHGRKPGES